MADNNAPPVAAEDAAKPIIPPKLKLNRLKARAAASDRLRIFIYDVVVLAILMALAAFYLAETGLFPTGDIGIALKAMWFGALGGVMISFKGTYEHADGPNGWDPNFNLWHLGRPLSGAVAGAVTLLVLNVVNGNTTGGNSASEAVVYIAAFIFGTQERRFFGFLYEAAKLIVRVPDDGPATELAITRIQPDEAAEGTLVMVSGRGIDKNATIKLGGAALDKALVANGGTSAAGITPARPGGTNIVDVVITNPNGVSFTLPNGFTFI